MKMTQRTEQEKNSHPRAKLTSPPGLGNSFESILISFSDSLLYLHIAPTEGLLPEEKSKNSSHLIKKKYKGKGEK